MATYLSKVFCMRYRSKIHAYISSYNMISNKRTYASNANAIAQNNEFLSRLQVVVTSREMIKPISPTPCHMNTVQLSILDQMAPFVHIPMIWFYQNDNPHPNHQPIDRYKRSMALKTSLSKILVDFYPLAGRTQDNVSIDCGDQGVEFCEAYADEAITNVIETPRGDEIRKLLPFKHMPRNKNIVLSVQVNHFNCGGMAISICVSHKIADGSGCIDFVKAWSIMARQGTNGARFEFNGASLCPPLSELNEITKVDTNKSLVSTRLIFDKKKIEELKSGVELPIKRPSRVEVVSAYVWELFMARLPYISTAATVVNLRTKTTPPIPEGCFGNFVLLTSTNSLPSGAHQRDRPMLINELRTAIKKMDNNYLEKVLKSEERLLEIKVRERDNINHGVEKCCFTSFCRFPLYEIDFGMGRPIWACIAPSPVKNLVVLSSTKCGQGVEALIHTSEDDAIALNLNYERYH